MVDDASASSAMGDAAHTNVLSNGANPIPKALVALALHNTNTDTQLQEATEYFDYLTNTTSNLMELNNDDVVRAALINMPNSSNVKVLFSAGLRSSGIGQTSIDDGNFLFLCGDGGNDIGTPASLSLPSTMCTKASVAVMTHTQFSTKIREKGNIFTWPLLPRDKVDTSKEIMQIAPIPPFLVYDGLESVLNAALIYERVLDADTHGMPVYQHAKDFLLSCLSKHNLPDNKPFIGHITLLQQQSANAKCWANARFKLHFPTLVPAPTTTTPTIPAVVPDLAAQIAAILAT